MATALQWLDSMKTDGDLKLDTRCAVPVAIRDTFPAGMGNSVTTAYWATLGVRLVRMEANYAGPLLLRPQGGEEPWRSVWAIPEVERLKLVASTYLLAVPEFAEFDAPGTTAYPRKKLRALCDREKTRDRILAALTGEP
jgi:hypothetical protein